MNLITKGVDIRIIQALLGHRSLKTAPLYLQVTNSIVSDQRFDGGSLNAPVVSRWVGCLQFG
jgi:hypothetical protein